MEIWNSRKKGITGKTVVSCNLNSWQKLLMLLLGFLLQFGTIPLHAYFCGAVIISLLPVGSCDCFFVIVSTAPHLRVDNRIAANMMRMPGDVRGQVYNRRRIFVSADRSAFQAKAFS